MDNLARKISTLQTYRADFDEATAATHALISAPPAGHKIVITRVSLAATSSIVLATITDTTDAAPLTMAVGVNSPWRCESSSGLFVAAAAEAVTLTLASAVRLVGFVEYVICPA